MLRASKYCSVTALSRVKVLWSLIPAEQKRNERCYQLQKHSGVNGQRYSISISAEQDSEGCCVPSSCIWSTAGSLTRGDSTLLSSVSKARFGHERQRSRAPFCCRRRRRNGCILGRSPREPGMLFLEVGRMATVGRSPLFSTEVTLRTGCSPPSPCRWQNCDSRLMHQQSGCGADKPVH